MALTAPQREEVSRAFQRRGHATGAYLKVPLLNAAGAIDDWLDANAAAFNAALPAGFRANASNQEKLTLLAFVALRRANLLPNVP
jgi:hypothetical protein